MPSAWPCPTCPHVSSPGCPGRRVRPTNSCAPLAGHAESRSASRLAVPQLAGGPGVMRPSTWSSALRRWAAERGTVLGGVRASSAASRESKIWFSSSAGEPVVMVPHSREVSWRPALLATPPPFGRALSMLRLCSTRGSTLLVEARPLATGGSAPRDVNLRAMWRENVHDIWRSRRCAWQGTGRCSRRRVMLNAAR